MCQDDQVKKKLRDEKRTARKTYKARRPTKSREEVEQQDLDRSNGQVSRVEALSLYRKPIMYFSDYMNTNELFYSIDQYTTPNTSASPGRVVNLDMSCIFMKVSARLVLSCLMVYTYRIQRTTR